ncbi:MAG: class I SAM-dependent methyltransferase [Gammaproteobacteria bacterium]|nr:class I SAM-dependent methyltransferase [Gammaproteobacteria bacterium]NBY22431.1 class I SAM-dependent methyltransferase [Gammaproteobacteria bacterium]NDE33608.1 class I SAM-dependent methyltransferase [Gammaproteobacteria bacterium]NDE56692.1 class I SAM-dependent methyltransferase [Gammaproteobacteria bacterium]NDG86696.1 class I SAM-dependent methyltransferase [Gammaproteobacteria bacterium]
MKPTIALDHDSFSKIRHPGLINHWAAPILRHQLEKLHAGEIILEDGVPHRYGAPTLDFEVSATLTVHHPGFYGATTFGGSLGAAESYMAGHWTTDNLVNLIRIMIRNRHVLDEIDGGWTHLLAPFRRLLHTLNRNSEEGSQRNIAAHYDLGNDFFKLFLDDTMMYSCALFEPQTLSLREASIAKLKRICERLALKPQDRIIEIGTGWGGFAVYAATHYGCHVTTTTISENQYEWAKKRITEARLEDRITLLKQDYRKLEGTFDKLVSIEMIEAVGHHYFETFFQQCSKLLKPDGLMLLQSITINDREYLRARDDVDFIKRYIFPGSCIPAIGPLLNAQTKRSDLQLIHLDDIGRHYATTLRQWRERFLERLDEVRAMGYSEPFIRLWEFYLAYCEGGFEERALGDVHMLFSKPLYREHPKGSN